MHCPHVTGKSISHGVEGNGCRWQTKLVWMGPGVFDEYSKHLRRSRIWLGMHQAMSFHLDRRVFRIAELRL